MQRIRGGRMDHVPGMSAGKAAEAVERNQSAGADPVLPKLQTGSRGGDRARGRAKCVATGAKSGPTRRVIQPRNGRKTACFAHEILAAGYVRAPGRAQGHALAYTRTHARRPTASHTPPGQKSFGRSAQRPRVPSSARKIPASGFRSWCG